VCLVVLVSSGWWVAAKGVGSGAVLVFGVGGGDRWLSMVGGGRWAGGGAVDDGCVAGGGGVVVWRHGEC
jgi:hypothetical protein